jgi:hypothetical protein
MSGTTTNKLYIGNSLNRSWQFLSGGVPVDLTGATASYGITNQAGAFIFQASVGDASGVLTIPNPTTGTVVLNISQAITTNFAASGYNAPYLQAITITYSSTVAQTYDVELLVVVPKIA